MIETTQNQLFVPIEPTFSNNEHAILAILEHHRGRRRAIRLSELALATGMEPRLIQSIVVDLICRHHCAIGSSSTAPPGFYLIQSDVEREQAERVLRSRIIALAKRLAALHRSSVCAIMDQLSFECIAQKDA